MVCHLAGCSQDGSGLGEEIVIIGFSVNGDDEHGVASILVGLQVWREGREGGEGG